MNPDEPDYFCARCYTKLPMGNCEESYCEGCDTPIHSANDYLSAEQLNAIRLAEDRRWSEAQASGLIVPRSGEAAP